jgi:hypothetical protein
LYLPEEWADDPGRRQKAHVPPEVTFQKAWRIAVDLLRRCRRGLPRAWITGAKELGRPAEFRDGLRRHGERYVLDVACDTSIRDLECTRLLRGPAPSGSRRP